MNIFILVIVGLVVFLLISLGIDFTRFIQGKNKEAESNDPQGLKCDSGGVLFVQGNKTYYNMPKGERRLIAEYAMDLTPGSRDMNMFLATMEQARKEKINEARNERKEAKLRMETVAKDVSREIKMSKR